MKLARIILLAAAAGIAGVLLWGYMAERYMADFMPLLVPAAGIGLIEVWRRLEARRPQDRRLGLAVILVAACYSVAVNLAIAAFPVGNWTSVQSARFISAEERFSLSNMADSVWVGSKLPYWAPAGQVFATSDCSGLYLSTGDTTKDVPGQHIEHYTWMPVEQAPSFTRTIGFTFNRSVRYLSASVPLMSYGRSTLVLQPVGHGKARIVLENPGTTISWPTADGWNFPIKYLHVQYRIVVTTDPNLGSLTVVWYGNEMLNHYVAGNGPARVLTTPVSSSPGTPVVTVASVASPPAEGQPMSLCRNILRSRSSR